MKSRIIKTISVALCFVFAFSFAACKKNVVQKVRYTGGVHNFSAPEINDKYFIKDGVSEYRIILPETASAIDRTARDEFNTLLRAATGITLAVETDAGKTFSESDKYISLGETALLSQAGIEVPKTELGMEGLIIVTKGDSVFLCGGSSYGTVYAVYDFMSIMFDYECYFTDCITIDKDVRTAKLRNFAVKDIPDFALRCSNYGFVSLDNENLGYRFREPYGYGTIMLPIHPYWKDIDGDGNTSDGREALEIDRSKDGYTAHNTLRGYVPREQYAGAHPKWFSNRGRQLCYTAGGDENELELLAQECAMKIEASLKAYTPKDWPLKNSATITIEDNNELCACEHCQASKAKYGTDSAACIILTNKINEYVRAWLENPDNAEYYREDFQILFFAYHSVTEAPASKDKKGVYHPNAPELKCDDGVSVWLAPINTDYQQDFYSAANAGYRDNLEKWASISDKIYFWNYSTNFIQMMYFYDCFSFYNTDGYQFLRAHSGYMNFNQAQGGQKGVATGFHTLKAYLDSKLSWDTTQNSKTLTDNWFNAMFREAAPHMKDLWLAMRLHHSKINIENNLYTPNIYQKVDSKANFPVKTLREWIGYTDKAFAAIEKYKEIDSELYSQTKAHIEAEWLSPAYIMLTLYKDELSPVELTAMRAEFKERALRLGITWIAESSGLITDFVRDF